MRLEGQGPLALELFAAMKETDPVGFVPGPGLPWIAGLSVLPFFLQFLGLGLSERLGTLLLLFLLTRTLPLPFSTPLGPALLAPAPLDPLSLIMVLPEPLLLWLFWRYRP